jgi:hypothetical protein
MSETASTRRRAPIIPVGVFTALYLVASAAFALIDGNGEFVFYIAVMVVLCGAVGLVHWRVHLPTPLLWGLSIWGLLHMAGGLVPIPESWPVDGPNRVLYSLWIIEGGLKYDQAVHAYGFGVATWVCWAGIKRAFATRAGARPGLGMLLMAALGGMGLGALNEVVEFAATQLLESTNVGGYVNTGWDLVSNLAGCILACLLIAILER